MYNYLNFTDAAKFADIARNLVLGLGYGGNFTFWAVKIFDIIKEKIFPFNSIPPVLPYSITAFFKIFGINDFAVMATSIFYFLLTLVFAYLLGKKLFSSKLVGFLSTLVVGGSYDLIHYALNGASESPFIFEIIAGLYFATQKKKWANITTIFFLILMYFTRPQAFIYIAGIILFWILNNFKIKKATLVFIVVIVAGLFVDHFILSPLNGKFFIYSVIDRSTGFSFNQSSTASDALRGASGIATTNIIQITKNIFYNLYNFYKALPEIINPYLFALFVISLFLKTINKEEHNFKIASSFMILTTFLITAASIPFYRYIHPVLPLIYIIAVGTLVAIINKFQKTNQKILILCSCLLVIFFSVGQTIGKFVLDSRFEAKTHNVGKPPVYVELSRLLRENTNPSDIVVTNLDTWGSWYGERKTVWFPLSPKQLIDPTIGEIPFDAIYLTSYKMDDNNYYMGEDWRMIFENPEDASKWKCDGCVEIAKKYSLKGIYTIDDEENYEKENASAILLVK